MCVSERERNANFQSQHHVKKKKNWPFCFVKKQEEKQTTCHRWESLKPSLHSPVCRHLIPRGIKLIEGHALVPAFKKRRTHAWVPPLQLHYLPFSPHLTLIMTALLPLSLAHSVWERECGVGKGSCACLKANEYIYTSNSEQLPRAGNRCRELSLSKTWTN